jgi:hypothetical protein
MSKLQQTEDHLDVQIKKLKSLQSKNEYKDLPENIKEIVSKEAEKACQELLDKLQPQTPEAKIAYLILDKKKVYLKHETEKWFLNEEALDAMAKLMENHEREIKEKDDIIDKLKRQIK